MSNSPPQIFISYTRANRRRIAVIARKLSDMGFSVWYDAELLPGQNFSQHIDRAFQGAKVILLCLSKKFIAKDGFCQKELKWAEEKLCQAATERIAVIPVLLEAGIEIPSFLHDIQYIKRSDKNFFVTLRHALTAAGCPCAIAIAKPENPITPPRPSMPRPRQKTNREIEIEKFIDIWWRQAR